MRVAAFLEALAHINKCKVNSEPKEKDMSSSTKIDIDLHVGSLFLGYNFG